MCKKIKALKELLEQIGTSSDVVDLYNKTDIRTIEYIFLQKHKGDNLNGYSELHD